MAMRDPSHPYWWHVGSSLYRIACVYWEPLLRFLEPYYPTLSMGRSVISPFVVLSPSRIKRVFWWMSREGSENSPFRKSRKCLPRTESIRSYPYWLTKSTKYLPMPLMNSCSVFPRIYIDKTLKENMDKCFLIITAQLKENMGRCLLINTAQKKKHG